MKVRIREICRNGDLLFGREGITDQTHWESEPGHDIDDRVCGFLTDQDKPIYGWYCVAIPSDGRLEMEAI